MGTPRHAVVVGATEREREREEREERERERSAMEGRMSVCGRASLGQFSVARARAQSVKRLRSTDAGRTCHTHQSPEEDTFELGQQSEEKGALSCFSGGARGARVCYDRRTKRSSSG